MNLFDFFCLGNEATPVWIGLQDFIQEGTFSWADGSALGAYTNWINNQPDNAGGNQVLDLLI